MIGAIGLLLSLVAVADAVVGSQLPVASFTGYRLRATDYFF
jgi:hypothetical protein